MIRRSTLLAAKIAGVLVLVAVVAIGLALARLAAGPVALPALERQLEAQLSESRGGRPVDIDGVQLSWSGNPRALQLEATGVRVMDARRNVMSRFSRATIGLGVLPMLIGRIVLVRADFEGGDLTVTMKPDGATELALGPPGSAPDVVIPMAEGTLAQRVANMLDGLEDAFRPIGPGGALRTISLRNATLEIIDEKHGGRWRAARAAIALDRTRNALALAIDARLEGPEGGAPATLRLTTDTKFREALIEFTASEARPRALLSPAMLGVFAGLDAPMTAAITVGLNRDVGVSRLEGDIALGRGSAEVDGERVRVDGGRLHGSYDLESDALTIDELALAGSRTRIRGAAKISNASSLLRATPAEPALFEVQLPSATFEMPGVFSAPFEVSQFQASGRISGGTIEFTQLRAQRDQARLVASGRLRFAAVGPERRLYPGIALNGRLEGPIDARSVLALWPLTFIEGARDYLGDAVQAGRLSDVTVALDIPPEEIAARELTDRSINIGFKFDNAQFRFLDTMSPLTNARGSAVLRGNRFDLTLDTARLNGLNLAGGRVEIPRFQPKGALMTIEARGEGDARAVIGLLMQQPIALGPRMPLDPNTVTGHGAVVFRMQRPNLTDVPYEQIRFTVDGRFDNVGGTMRESGLALTQGNLRVRGDQSAITISGPMQLGASQVNVSWTERIGQDIRNSSRYQIAGQFDANDLERLGYPARMIARGRVGVTVSGEGAGFNVDSAQISLDLARATAFLPGNLWLKRPGAPATISLTAQRERDGTITLANIQAAGSGLNARGEAHLTRDGKFQRANFPAFTVDERANLVVAARTAGDGALEVEMRGPMIDATPFLDLSSSDERDQPPPRPAQQQASAAQAALPQTTRVAVRVDQMKLRAGAALSNARADVILVGEELRMLDVTGRSPGNKLFQLGFGPRSGNPQGALAFQAEDAGFAWRGITGADNIVGGRAFADGTWRPSAPGVAQLNLHMRDFKVVRAPAMAHVLGSVASLTGVVEMLNGEGISFSSLDAPVTIAGPNLTFSQARMAGPTLGFTATGSYDMAADNLDVNGVVVPSYGVNSILGRMPLIGDLFVSRRGEGVFGMTYDVQGHAAAPRVGVNPLALVTPGILRRIFEPFGSRNNNNRAGEPARAQANTPRG